MANRTRDKTGMYFLIECDLMHCELNVTWELFVKNNK